MTSFFDGVPEGSIARSMNAWRQPPGRQGNNARAIALRGHRSRNSDICGNREGGVRLPHVVKTLKRDIGHDVCVQALVDPLDDCRLELRDVISIEPIVIDRFVRIEV